MYRRYKAVAREPQGVDLTEEAEQPQRPAAWLRRAVSLLQRVVRSPQQPVVPAPKLSVQQYAMASLPAMPQNVLALVMGQAGGGEVLAGTCRQLRSSWQEAMRDPTFAADALLQRCRGGQLCWPGCKQCCRRHCKKPGSQGSAAAHLTEGCGGPMLGWLLGCAPKDQRLVYLEAIMGRLAVAVQEERRQGSGGMHAAEALSLLLSGAGCCGCLTTGAVAPELQLLCDTAVPAAEKQCITAGAESGLRAACFRGDVRSAQLLLRLTLSGPVMPPALLTPAPDSGRVVDGRVHRLWAAVQLASCGTTPGHTQLLSLLIALGAPVQESRCWCVDGAFRPCCRTVSNQLCLGHSTGQPQFIPICRRLAHCNPAAGRRTPSC
jgi:hypothetical protein